MDSMICRVIMSWSSMEAGSSVKMVQRHSIRCYTTLSAQECARLALHAPTVNFEGTVQVWSAPDHSGLKSGRQLDHLVIVRNVPQARTVPLQAHRSTNVSRADDIPCLLPEAAPEMTVPASRDIKM